MLADSGSKVNGLKRPFHLRNVYYQLLQVLPYVGRDKLEKWNGGGCRWFLPSSSAWLKLIGRRMELENPFASVLDSATTGMNALVRKDSSVNGLGWILDSQKMKISLRWNP